MKTLHPKFVLGSLALVVSALTCVADTNVVLTTSDANGAVTSLNGVGRWNDGNPPHAGANYFTTNFFIRTPTDGGGVTYTFGGDSLSLGPVTGSARNIIVKSGNGDTFIINNLTNLQGGILENGGSGNVTATFTGNLWTISTNSAVVADQGPLTIGYPLAGPDGAILTNAGGNGTGITFNGTNTAFTGKFYISLANFGNGGGATHVILNAANGFLGNPSTPSPDQVRLEAGCSLQDNVGLTINNANGGILLFGSATINAGAVTTMGEAITDLTNGVSAISTLTKGGTGTLVLSNANNNFSGGTTVSAGTLQLGVDNAIPGNSTNGNVTVSSGAILDMNGHVATINGLNGAGTVDSTLISGTPTLTIGANGASGTFTGLIQNSVGSLSLTKVGAGTETLAAYNNSGTVTVDGGTLSVTPAAGMPAAPGNLVVNNGTLAINAPVGIPLPAATLVLDDNATNDFAFGTVSGNPTNPVITATAISAPGTNVVINITALGLRPGIFTLIKYSGTALSGIANFSLSAPPGVNAMLVNNQLNDSIDIDIGSAPNQLSWNGVNGSSWDLTTANWSNTVAGGITVFQQYTNAGLIAGDSVLFDDTLTNTSPQPTNVTIATTFFAFPVVENSTLPYTLSGAGGITGPTSLVKSNTGPWTVLTSNSYTGGAFVYGGQLVVNNDSALGTNNGAVQLNGGDLEYVGSSTNNVRPFTLAAAGNNIGVSVNNTVQLGGIITGAGGLYKQDLGTLILSGKTTLPSGSAGNLFVKFGTATIPSGGAVTNGYYDDVGQDTNDSATLNITGGSLTTLSDFNVGDLGASAGTLNISSGTLRANAIFIGSANASGSTASGTVNQSGGTVTEINGGVGEFCIGGRTSVSGVGVYNLTNGTLTANAGIRVGSTGIGSLNQYGGTINAMAGLNIARISGSFGTNNLNGGTLATFNVTSSTGSNAVFNFNGGILKAAFTNGTPWMNNLSQANILAGGAIIDDGGGTPLITQGLLAGSANGGLTKQGSGMLTLTGINTFTGPITNNAGTLFLNSASTYPGAVQINAGTVQVTTASQLQGAITVNSNANFAIFQNGSATESVGLVTLNGSGNLPGAALTLALGSGNNPGVPFVNVGTLTLTGTNSIILAGAANVGSIALVKYSSIAGSGNITNLTLPQGVVGSISNDVTDSILYAVITTTGPGIFWTGTNSSPSLTNVWGINSATNWLLNTSPTRYQQVVVPGDAVTFNDSGSGTVLLSNSAGPASLVISNNARAYAFSGTGLITGPTGITKLGTGTATINLANSSYTGNTTISNGTLQVGGSAAISSAANVVVGPSGTLELAGNNQTAGELIGSGVVNNDNGTRSILTVGGASGGTWNGTITNTGGAGGVTLHKLGSGTWVVGGSNYLNDGQSFQVQDSVNAGTLIITNGGLVSIPYLELRIADGTNVNNANSTVVVAGGTLVVTNNPISVGVNSNNADGTFIVNSGTVITATGNPAGLFAGSPNDLVVGASGATGTMIVNGGLVVVGQSLWLGQNVGTGGSGTLDLNGGVLQVGSIANSGTPTTSVANFNGGTLEGYMDTNDFLDPASPATYNIMSNGLVLNDGGFTLSVAAALQAGDGFNGGVIKTGAGTVYFDVANAYTGTTVVTNGTFGGIGSLTGPLVVGPAGNVAPGDAGATVGSPLTVSSSLTLQGKATFRISVTASNPANDQITGIVTANYGGTLVVSNVTSDTTLMTNGQTFPLFSATTGTGNFANIVGSPGAGLSYVFNPATGVLSVTNAVVVKSVPHFTTIHLSGTTLTIAGTNGTPSGQYVLIGSTNILLPLAQWTPLLTNSFDTSGNFNLTTNIVNPAVTPEFYLLSQ